MTSPYKRRRSSLVRSFWFYRWLIVLAFVLGLMLWFVVINDTQVTVYFPFRMGQISSRLGLVLLLAGMAGSALTAVTMALVLAVRRHRATGADTAGAESSAHDDDRPPADYAVKAKEGFPDAPWSAR
jgi:uncharacterized integral membrane protein